MFSARNFSIIIMLNHVASVYSVLSSYIDMFGKFVVIFPKSENGLNLSCILSPLAILTRSSLLYNVIYSNHYITLSSTPILILQCNLLQSLFCNAIYSNHYFAMSSTSIIIFSLWLRFGMDNYAVTLIFDESICTETANEISF